LREIFTENQEDELQIVVAQKSIEKDEIEEISTPTISKYASHLRDLDAETNTTTAEIKDSPAKLINESSHFNEINDCEVSAAKEEVLNRLIMENLCIIRENLASAEFIKKDDVDFSKAFLKYMKTSGNAYEYKKVANSQSNISNTEWRTTTPIYVADGSRSTHPVFPQRNLSFL
jgi:hypothetical protein